MKPAKTDNRQGNFNEEHNQLNQYNQYDNQELTGRRQKKSR